MSDNGAEGILRRRAEEKAAATPTAPAQPVDQGTAGHKPGRIKSAASGAAGGAAGGPWGAAAGAVTGALTGGKGKKAGGHKALVAEFMICMTILLLSPMVDKGGNVTTAKFMKKASATAAVFIILGFIGSAGDTARKAATGLGMLMTLTVLLNERSVFGQLVKAVSGSGVSVGPAIPLGGGEAADSGTTGSLGQPLSLQDQTELGGGIASDAGTAVNRWVRGLFGDPTVAPLLGVPSPQSDPTGYLDLFGAVD